MINCDDAAKYFHEYLDKELSREDIWKVEEHLHKCRHCFGHVEFDRALRELLKKKMVETTLSPEIKQVIAKKLYQEVH
jgi:mycothiol system anti-sigma-R factor